MRRVTSTRRHRFVERAILGTLMSIAAFVMERRMRKVLRREAAKHGDEG